MTRGCSLEISCSYCAALCPRCGAPLAAHRMNEPADPGIRHRSTVWADLGVGVLIMLAVTAAAVIVELVGW